MVIVPIFPSLDSYAHEVQKKLWLAGFQVECDLDAGTTLNKKIRQNQLAQFNFIGGKISLTRGEEFIQPSPFSASGWSTRKSQWND